MPAERLEPVIFADRPPCPLGRFEERRVARERTRRQHGIDPAARRAAAGERRTGRVPRQSVQVLSGSGRPHSLSLATPPSGKMFSRTCVIGMRAWRAIGIRWRALARSVVLGTSSRQLASSPGLPPPPPPPPPSPPPPPPAPPAPSPC